MSDKLIELLDKYEAMFDDGFPTFQLMRGREEKEVIEMIEKCIKAKKDAYAIGYLSLDDEDEY